MQPLLKQIDEARSHIATRWAKRPRVGIILGTGLGGLAARIGERATIPYGEIPHFSASTVESHAGQLKRDGADRQCHEQRAGR